MPSTKPKLRTRLNIFNLFSTKKSPTTKTRSKKPKQSSRYTLKLKKSVSSPNTKNKIKTMDNSIEILNIIRDSVPSSLSTCPSKITKEMLAIELDCEDLRANLEKETKDSLWSAYREVNSHLFRDRPPPTKQDLKELQNLIDKIKG